MKVNFDLLVNICVGIDTAILGIAFPLIIDVGGKIGDKYNSSYIKDVFRLTFPAKRLSDKLKVSWFEIALYVTVFSFLFLFLNIPAPVWWLSNSASWLTLVLSITLITFFLFWIANIKKFTADPGVIVKYLEKNFFKNNDNPSKQVLFLKAINEFSIYALKKGDERLEVTLLKFYWRLVQNEIKRTDKGEPVVYANDFYEIAYRLSRIVSGKDNIETRALEHRVSSGAWFLGLGVEKHKLSESTYNWLWLMVNELRNRESSLKDFWANSYQYYSYQLRQIEIKYDKSFKEINKAERQSRELERKDFFEFHLAFGGLLIFNKKYEVIKYAFQYTQSQPPNYPLLPISMTEVFNWFDIIYNNDYISGRSIDLKYRFSGTDNLGDAGYMVQSISKYIVLLFLRQFSLQKYLTIHRFTDAPKLPDEVIELERWKRNLKSFKIYFHEIINDSELMQVLSFDKLYKEKQEDVSLLLNDVVKSIDEKIIKTKTEGKIDPDKEKQFFDATKRIIGNSFEKFSKFTQKEVANPDETFKIEGASVEFPKSAFVKGANHLNFDTIIPEMIVNRKIDHAFTFNFFQKKTKRYVIESEKLFECFSKLGVNKSHLIIGFNLFRDIELSLNESDLKSDIKFLQSQSYNRRNILFVMNKSDLPTIKFSDVDDEIKNDLKLNLIENKNDFKLYASVQPLPITDIDNLEVLTSIQFKAELEFPKEREIIQLDVSTKYDEKGIANNINDIGELKKGKR
tara:strand:+ start:8047 stop:10263 length:2217 start_codon:yes stop_codon:yes gene_type:complete